MSENEGKPVKIAGQDLVCRHCGFKAFVALPARMEVYWMIFVGHELASAYACIRCGCIHWFMEPPSISNVQDFAEGELTEPVACLSCGEVIPAGQTQCASCGWSYQAPGREESAADAEADELEDAEAGSGAADGPTECVSCGATVPAGQSKCPACGWTYEADQP